MSISAADVRHVAALARVGIDDARVPVLVTELNGILVHMDALQQVSLPDEDAAEVSTGMPLRDDQPGSVALRIAREAFAPAMRDGFFLVPRIATHGAAGGAPATDAGALDDMGSR